MAKDWWKWCLAVGGGVCAGVMATALWMDARAWRAQTEGRLDALEVSGAPATGREGEAAGLIAAAQARMLEVAQSGAAGPRGCEGAGASPGAPLATGAGGVGLSAEEWLARQEAS